MIRVACGMGQRDLKLSQAKIVRMRNFGRFLQGIIR